MNEVMELLIDGFEEAIKDGPLAREKASGILITIVDATIHEDPVHRGPAQVIPAARNGVYASMLTAGVFLLEPIQIYTIEAPQDYMSGLITFVQSKRGQVQEIGQEGEDVKIVVRLPVAETLKGFSNDLRGLTQGRATWYTEFAGFEKLPANIQSQVVREIRQRKGQPPEPPTANDFMI
jgi:elongation factor 2